MGASQALNEEGDLYSHCFSLIHGEQSYATNLVTRAMHHLPTTSN
jgi:hypothetical protein